jgi:hypothetical protein
MLRADQADIAWFTTYKVGQFFQGVRESSNIGLVVKDSLPANANTIFGGHLVPREFFWDVLCHGTFFWDVLCRGTFSAWDVLRVGRFESGTFWEWDVLRVGRFESGTFWEGDVLYVHLQTYSCAHCCVFYSEMAYFQLASPYGDRITRFFISSLFFFIKKNPPSPLIIP